jgi:hypothetical protein
VRSRVLSQSQFGRITVMNTIADKMALQWAGIEGAMKFANNHPAFRPRVEALVESYFALIDEMVVELERCRVKQGES